MLACLFTMHTQNGGRCFRSLLSFCGRWEIPTRAHNIKCLEMITCLLFSNLYHRHTGKTLPAGSHVFLVGLVDGHVLYDSLKDRIHPIGSLRNDVTYTDFYNYFNCLEISPCLGWLNTNETIRNMTTKRAMELSSVLKDVAKTEASKYSNFKLDYMENPIFQAIEEFKKLGIQTWEALEPVDGFHSNQLGQALSAQVMWQNLETKYPDAIGPMNPFNDKIKAVFGNQGGY
ncbi:acyloxyacyl hydrolase-like isoform X3 [Argopecten irradians]|uniref:acyloxyacyl hydrolase-like isoform X3 n=1 Tax=Argopecten irradians TaxID=31199 RepID=UPI00371AF005